LSEIIIKYIFFSFVSECKSDTLDHQHSYSCSRYNI